VSKYLYSIIGQYGGAAVVCLLLHATTRTILLVELALLALNFTCASALAP
jgi:hypothetical protein